MESFRAPVEKPEQVVEYLVAKYNCTYEQAQALVEKYKDLIDKAKHNRTFIYYPGRTIAKKEKLNLRV